MSNVEADWSTGSNQAVNIHLVSPTKTLHNFHPKFTYSIFGDEETIFGYQGLNINLKYHACDMRPLLQVNYNKKFKAVGETEPTDLKAILEGFLPKTAFEKTSDFQAAISSSTFSAWTPPGELWKTINTGSKTLEIWKGSLADMAVQQIVKRIQILVPFFIEGGTAIDLREPEWSLERWTVFFLYERKRQDGLEPNTSPYHFMGYSTVYKYYFYQTLAPPSSPEGKKKQLQPKTTHDFTFPLPEFKLSSLPSRSRISQFLLLPPYQRDGNGSRFYNAIFDYFLQDPSTIEITVEDPNEAFDDLRDLNDLARLRTLPEFLSLKINTSVQIKSKGPVPKEILNSKLLEEIRTKLKIAPRQFARVVEMQMLSLIPLGIRQSLLDVSTKNILDKPAREFEYRLWNLWVKMRLYKHNKDMLIQLDRAERIQRLEEVTGGVEADYARLLRNFDERIKAAQKSLEANGKRPAPGNDDEEADGEPAAKKVKV
ncbi:hypothetical protein HYFRA_00000349 [Hymenoscyphus fraxineus]|uniref:Histone acetyltransferase type B catalytic subunit n=1 Tax=Hymenoscyphus fraxineus TaxID=746836 RepID=A0A9N9L3P0_9HELO|nr:hypothetical protein HYFRA_00000349 [Hymenoscyphus fraxineus]